MILHMLQIKHRQETLQQHHILPCLQVLEQKWPEIFVYLLLGSQHPSIPHHAHCAQWHSTPPWRHPGECRKLQHNLLIWGRRISQDQTRLDAYSCYASGKYQTVPPLQWRNTFQQSLLAFFHHCESRLQSTATFLTQMTAYLSTN